MPGNERPSRNSSEAPPPVDRWSNASASSAFFTASRESPPPTTLNASACATAVATPACPR